MKEKDWFEEWFDSPYYHLLYSNRDELEAQRFISNLSKQLQLAPGSNVLDLACGKGRHSVTLAQHGYNVLGLDLAASSIREAKIMEHSTLKFDVHDMREIYPNKQFHAIFNLFTSFGYFDSISDNAKVIRSIFSMLESNGILVIDFMNAQKVIGNLVANEEKTVEPITFHINRHYNGTHLFKKIQFEDKGVKYSFTERVQTLQLSDFKELLEKQGFEIICTFGDFDLKPFHEQDSDRLILIAQKK